MSIKLSHGYTLKSDMFIEDEISINHIKSIIEVNVDKINSNYVDQSTNQNGDVLIKCEITLKMYYYNGLFYNVTKEHVLTSNTYRINQLFDIRYVLTRLDDEYEDYKYVDINKDSDENIINEIFETDVIKIESSIENI